MSEQHAERDHRDGQSTKYSVPDGHWDEDDVQEENDAHPTDYIKSHTVDVYADDEPDPKDNYGRTKYTAHITYRDGEPSALYVVSHRWKGNFWRDIKDLDWRETPSEVKRRVASVVACDGVDDLDPGVRLIEEEGVSRWEKIHMPRMERMKENEEKKIRPDDLQAYVDDIRHNSERRSYASVDADTLDQVADELEELIP